jgi:hypothetical protein
VEGSKSASYSGFSALHKNGRTTIVTSFFLPPKTTDASINLPSAADWSASTRSAAAAAAEQAKNTLIRVWSAAQERKDEREGGSRRGSSINLIVLDVSNALTKLRTDIMHESSTRGGDVAGLYIYITGTIIKCLLEHKHFCGNSLAKNV